MADQIGECTPRKEGFGQPLKERCRKKAIYRKNDRNCQFTVVGHQKGNATEKEKCIDAGRTQKRDI